jgi:hypothetical protein
MPDLRLRQGCTSGKPSENTAQADALVLFGAMGDLAHKKIFPLFITWSSAVTWMYPWLALPEPGGRTNISNSGYATASSSKARTSIKKPWPSFRACLAMLAAIIGANGSQGFLCGRLSRYPVIFIPSHPPTRTATV